MQHPSQIIAPDDADELRSYAADAEKSEQLHPAQIAAIRKNNWFNLFVPRSMGGLELSLPAALEIEEALAWVDGSLGWTVTLCSGAAWFIGFLDPVFASTLFADPHVCLAGSGRPTGTASLTKDGYLINGAWNYASGAPFATAFTANCLIEKNGSPQLNEDGTPKIRSFVFMRDEVSIIDNWQTFGMIATASKGYAVNNVLVPFDRSFLIQAEHRTIDAPIFRFPFLPFAEATLAANFSGMALRFFELSERAPADKNAAAQQTLEEARMLFFSSVQKAWEHPDTHHLSLVSQSSRALALTARQLTEAVYPYCGMIAANPGTEINRVFRNLHTASQHPLLL